VGFTKSRDYCGGTNARFFNVVVAGLGAGYMSRAFMSHLSGRMC
jgi:hypothetical protein